MLRREHEAPPRGGCQGLFLESPRRRDIDCRRGRPVKRSPPFLFPVRFLSGNDNGLVGALGSRLPALFLVLGRDIVHYDHGLLASFLKTENFGRNLYANAHRSALFLNYSRFHLLSFPIHAFLFKKPFYNCPTDFYIPRQLINMGFYMYFGSK